MRDKLQALADVWKHLADAQPEDDWLYAEGLSLAVKQLESILATEPPAVTVRAGWYAKDYGGIHWFEREPTWFDEWDYTDDLYLEYEAIYSIGDVIIDPWPDHPNGGPECCVEVR